jgi:hypothetical protein
MNHGDDAHLVLQWRPFEAPPVLGQFLRKTAFPFSKAVVFLKPEHYAGAILYL